MTCILRIARISNVEIIMSRGVLIKRVEFREDVREKLSVITMSLGLILVEIRHVSTFVFVFTDAHSML